MKVPNYQKWLSSCDVTFWPQSDGENKADEALWAILSLF